MELELIDAIKRRDFDVAHSLIKRGANVNYVPHRGKTALATAAAAGHVPMMIMMTLCSSTRDEKQDSNSNPDCYIFEDEASPLEGTEDLEWDTEMEGWEGEGAVREGDPEPGAGGVDDVWSRQYRWYAEILDKTAGLTSDLGRKCDLDLQDCVGRTALHYAVEHCQIGALHFLVDSGCKVDVSDGDGLTPLHLAAMRGHEEMARALVRRGANVNRKTVDKMAPLHYAAGRGSVQMVRLLVEEGGAHIDPLDTSDRTPLMLAVTRGHRETVAVLVRYGVKLNIEEIHGYSPLCEAVWSKSAALAELLLRSGAKLTQSHHLLHHAVRHGNHTMAALLLSLGAAYPNLRDDRGDTPLIVAILAADIAMVKLLLKHNASPSYANSISGVTPLVRALRLTDDQFEQTVTLLCDHGVDLEQRCIVEFSYRSNALTMAMVYGSAYKIATLVRAGADVNAVDPDVLSLAEFVKHEPDNRWLITLVGLLVSAGWDLSRVESLEYPKNFSKLKPRESIRDLLTVARYNAPRLVDLCRLKLRARMRHRVLNIVPQLHIPYSLKAFLLLQDFYIEKSTSDNRENAESFPSDIFG